MATKHEIADSLQRLQDEMANRIDDLEMSGDMTSSAVTSMSGILEGLASIGIEVRRCNGKPSVRLGKTNNTTCVTVKE